MPAMIQKVTLYHDSNEPEIHENFQQIRNRVADLREQFGVYYEMIDVAEWSRERVIDLLNRFERNLRPHRKYYIGKEILTHFAFVRLRPVLVINYEQEQTGIDIYPHRYGSIQNGEVITIGEFITEIEQLTPEELDEISISTIDRTISEVEQSTQIDSEQTTMVS